MPTKPLPDQASRSNLWDPSKECEVQTTPSGEVRATPSPPATNCVPVQTTSRSVALVPASRIAQAETVSGTPASTPSTVASMTTVPAASAVTRPLLPGALLTAATAASELLQVTESVTSYSLPSRSRPVA